MNAIQTGSTGNEMLTQDQSVLSELPDSIPEELRERVAQLYSQDSPADRLNDAFPPLSLLAQYEPDVQRIILDEAVEDRKHRARMEVRRQQQAFYRRISGLLLGFLVALALMIGSVYIIIEGHSVEGLIVLCVSIAAAAYAWSTST